MAPKMQAGPGEGNLDNSLNLISNGNTKDRNRGLDDLIFLMSKKVKIDDGRLSDKTYHRIFDSLFKCVVSEKQSYFGGTKKTSVTAASTRLIKCADALRHSVKHGASKLKRKTLLALIGHITETLPGPDGDLIEPLAANYIKALMVALAHQANVEQISTYGAEGWLTCVDFLNQAISRATTGSEKESGSGSRGSPAPSLGMTMTVTFSGRSGSGPQKPGGAYVSSTTAGLIECLQYLVTPANAPVALRAREISDSILQFLHCRQWAVGLAHQSAFAAASKIMTSIHASDLSLASSFARDLVPLIGHWWQSRSADRDASIQVVRDEILNTIFSVHLQLEHLCLTESDDVVRRDIDDTIDMLLMEYSRRDERSQLQLDDLTFATASLPSHSFTVGVFALRPHNLGAERLWALLQNLALLENIIVRSGPGERPPSADDQGLPRKKRRTAAEISRIRQRLKSPELGVQATTLQMIPFLIHRRAIPLIEASRLITDLAALAGDKQPGIASWAMLACASCALVYGVDAASESTWRQLWQIAARSAPLAAVSRPACALLHALLDADVLPYHIISDDINSIVTTADVNGPAVVVDSSLLLMLHMLHLRNAKLPSASQATCHHIIRWLFARWSPTERSYATLHSPHTRPLELVDLIQTCCGSGPLPDSGPVVLTGGSCLQTWQVQQASARITRYLLLLDDEQESAEYACSQTKQLSDLASAADPASFHASKTLVLELFFPKLEELEDLCLSWTRRASEGGTQISSEMFQSLFSACITGILLIPLLSDMNSRQSRDIESSLFKIISKSLDAILDALDSDTFFDAMLRSVRIYMPTLSATEMTRLVKDNGHLLQLWAKLAETMRERTRKQASGQHVDLMDLDDDDFESQASRSSSATKPMGAPRQALAMRFDPAAFNIDTAMRLSLLNTIYGDRNLAGVLPSSFIDELIGLSSEEFLSCRGLLNDMIKSDLVLHTDDASRIVQTLGDFMGATEFETCEVALCACLDALEGLSNVWTDDKLDIAEMVGDLYNHFIKTALPGDYLSPEVQVSLVRFLFRLIQVDPRYGSNMGLSSCRTILLSMMQTGSTAVKYVLASRISDIFALFVLKTHDDVFVDVLDSLPTDPEFLEGIYYRLFVLAELGCRWPTLLRRCTYHVFETAGVVQNSAKHATRCLGRVSTAMGLSSPQELFALFAPQLMYTWLEEHSIDDISHEIFGFASLHDLLGESQAEAAGLMVMRSQEDAVKDLASRLGISVQELVRRNFTKIMAYTIAHDMSSSKSDGSSAEARVKKLIGRDLYIDAVYANFADIVALFFALIDQEDPLEKYLAKDENLAYAARIMDDIKKMAYSDVTLPPNQQPMFKAKHLVRQLFFLASRTEYEFHSLWTPALVVSVARKLLNAVHPSLGPLHACSVLRKVRVLICLAGPVALEGYPLEMLLHSIRAFIVDSECADDALGMSQYLLTHGSKHMLQAPSFLTGYALSTLASLRVFLESSQASTTQESQFKATMSKAQRFHSWFSKYLADHSSSSPQEPSKRDAFTSITQSAAQIRSSGNAERGTHESNLLLEILQDDQRDSKLLDESARSLALGLLCGDFNIPQSVRDDIIETDADALRYSGVIWSSCRSQALSNDYLAWAGRAVGRAFAASGEIQLELLRESSLATYLKLAVGNNGSEHALVDLMQAQTMNSDSFTAGLAESALRAVVSAASEQEDAPLLEACQNSMSEPLFLSSQWSQYRTPPSDNQQVAMGVETQVLSRDRIEKGSWMQDLALYLASAAPDYVTLRVLSPILTHVKGFAQQSLPFIVHVVLSSQLDKQQSVKRSLSDAFKEWLAVHTPASKDNLRLLVNALLYLRTQPIPNETSIADRVQWLDIDFSLAASAASWCGMYKTALLFAELGSTETGRTSRRSSAARVGETEDVLLSIYENVDDPDAYYGLKQPSSLSNVLARLEYEKDGSKSLAFRGAQYDSHIRRRDPLASSDSKYLVQALSSLGLSGLSHSLLQTQQNVDESTTSLESTFQTARRLGIWNLPVPTTSTNHAVTLYKAYQGIHIATESAASQAAIYEGLSQTMRILATKDMNAAMIRRHLGSLAILTELDDALRVSGVSDLEECLAKFEARSKWMRRGRYDDISQILSCRETTLSLLSHHPKLRGGANVTAADARKIEVKAMLMASGIYRFHQATQESLNISTTLTDLIAPCEALGLDVDAAVRIEAANSLWDHGEMSSSIRLLQSIDRDLSRKKQTVLVSRSDLLSKIGYQVSTARLEKPHDIQKNYLEPALKELKGKADGKQAGQVFHQFAMFCDEQLQNSESLEDLARLQKLKKGKSEEVEQYKELISSTRDSQLRGRYTSHLSRAKQWLELDEQELRRVEHTRSEFVKLSLENYLLSLIASDEHNTDALRFSALWLERSGEESTNQVVAKNLDSVPTRKFAPLMNQLTSRLQDQQTLFQKLLLNLVYKICVDHPYHGMYQIWSGIKYKVNSKDEVAVRRRKATEQVSEMLSRTPEASPIWIAIDKTSRYYHALASDKDSGKYKSGAKVAVTSSAAGQHLANALRKYSIPPPTMQIELSVDKDYSQVPTITKLEPSMSIASGVSAPKIITVVGSNGEKYQQLVKSGNDDLRQDAIMEQVFSAVSSLLKLHRTTQQRNLGIRTYKVLPLTSTSGLIEFVPNTIPLHEFLMPAHERYYPKDLKGAQCRKEISTAQNKSIEVRLGTYRKVTERFHPVMRYFFMENFLEPDDWFAKRLAYTRTTAAISMLGHVLGLGDRHGHNILLDKKTGEAVHIDLGVAFEMGRILPVPEVVPFRLTRDIVDGMGVTGTEGVFRRCCEFTLDALREETYSIMTILDVLRYDPLYSWSISPLRMAKLQDSRRGEEGNPAAAGNGDDDQLQSEIAKKTKKNGAISLVNEPSEADRALEVVRKKLSKTLSVAATVNDLINQATDERNLAVLYSGWAAYA